MTDADVRLSSLEFATLDFCAQCKVAFARLSAIVAQFVAGVRPKGSKPLSCEESVAFDSNFDRRLSIPIFTQMIERGLLQLWRGDVPMDPRTDVASLLLPPHSPAASCAELVVIGVSEAGGAAWEAYANPSWAAYIDVFEYGDGRVEMLASHEGLVRSYARLLAGGGGQLQITALPRWNPVHWKTFSDGVSAVATLPAGMKHSWDDQNEALSHARWSMRRAWRKPIDREPT